MNNIEDFKKKIDYLFYLFMPFNINLLKKKTNKKDKITKKKLIKLIKRKLKYNAVYYPKNDPIIFERYVNYDSVNFKIYHRGKGFKISQNDPIFIEALEYFQNKGFKIIARSYYDNGLRYNVTIKDGLMIDTKTLTEINFGPKIDLKYIVISW